MDFLVQTFNTTCFASHTLFSLAPLNAKLDSVFGILVAAMQYLFIAISWSISSDYKWISLSLNVTTMNLG